MYFEKLVFQDFFLLPPLCFSSGGTGKVYGTSPGKGKGVLSLVLLYRLSTWGVIFLTCLWMLFSNYNLWEFSLYGLVWVSAASGELSCSPCVEPPEIQFSFIWPVILGGWPPQSIWCGIHSLHIVPPLAWHTQILTETPTPSHDNLWISPMTFGDHGK